MTRTVTLPGRAMRVFLVAARHGVAHALRRWLLGQRPHGPQRLRRLLEDLGGVYLKLGQLLSLQPDILPPRYCRALSDLLDRVPAFPFREVEALFQTELGQSPLEIFEDFDRKPLATASIAQVHAAVLNGRPVAVKVRRPTVGRDFEPDLRLIRQGERLLRRWGPRRWAWLPGALQELDRWTREELDFRCEARVLAMVRRDAEGRAGEVIPALVEALSGPRILVAELLEGPTLLTALRRLESGAGVPEGIDPEAVAGHIVDNFTDSAFRRGLFHADLHPANLLILPGSTVGYVDFGIAGSLSAHSRRSLLRMILALHQGDDRAFHRAFLQIAVLRPGSDPAALGRGIGQLLAGWSGSLEATTEAPRRFTLLMLDLLTLSRTTNVWPAPEVLRYFRSAISTDGLIQRFAPGFDLGARLDAGCRRLMEEMTLRDQASMAALADWGAAGMRWWAAEATRAAAPALTVDGSLEETGGKSRSPGRRAIQLLLLGSGCALAALFHPAPHWGLNLFSAELIATGAATLSLVSALHRMARNNPRSEV